MYNNAGGGFIPNHHQQQQQHHQHQLHPMNQNFWALPSREGGPIQQNAISGLSVKRSLHQEEEGTEGHDKVIRVGREGEDQIVSLVFRRGSKANSYRKIDGKSEEKTKNSKK